MKYNTIIHIDPSIDLNSVSTYSKSPPMAVFSNAIKKLLLQEAKFMKLYE